METRTYLIFSSTEIRKINFEEILEKNLETITFNIEGTKCFVKWEGIEPSFVKNLTTIEGFYNREQMLSILRTSEWLPEIF